MKIYLNRRRKRDQTLTNQNLPAVPTRRPGAAGLLDQPKKEEEDRRSLGGKSDTSDGQARDLPVRDLTDVHKFGFLLKRRKEKVLFSSEYQKRFCVVAGSTFYYYEKDIDLRPQGSFSLKDYEARDATGMSDKRKADVTFVLTCPGQRTYQFQTENRRDQEDWKRIINYTVPDWLNANAGGGNAEGMPDASNAAPKPPLPLPPSTDSEYLGMYITPNAPSEAPKPQQPMEEFYCDASSSSTTGGQQVEQKEIYYTDAISNPSSSFLHSGAAVTGTTPPSANKVKQHGRELPPVPAEEQQPTKPRGPLPPAPSSEQINNDPSVDYENYYYAKWDCKANNPDELSFSQGDEIHIIGREYDKYNWWVGELKGRLGIVPKTFLQPAFELVSN